MEKVRYSRLEALPGIGAEGVAKLRGGKVMVVGCGALGSLCAMYLAASGTGTVGIADFDTIDISNRKQMPHTGGKYAGHQFRGNSPRISCYDQ